ncbi:hypothetical protein MTO96_000706 [Rhipicephalus appendiculatus]
MLCPEVVPKTDDDSLQTLFDASTQGGGDVDMAWADGFRDQQDETFAMLAEIDKYHENILDMERMRQEQEPDFCMTRPSAQAQLPMERRIVKAARSYDSIEVFVDGGVSSAVFDEVLHDRSDPRLSSPYRVIPCRPSCVLSSRFLGNGRTSRSARIIVFPAPPPSREGSPCHDPAVA